MKKILSLIAFLILIVSNAMAGEVFTYTFTGGKATSVPSGFFSYDAAGKWSFNSKFKDCEYDGQAFTNGLKMEGSTKILFTTTEPSTVTIVQSEWSNHTIKLDGTELAVADAVPCTGGRVYTVANVQAGDHNITRGSGESGLFLVKVQYADKAKAVTFINDAAWEKVFVWAWNDTENFTGGEWPGQELTADGEGNYTWSTMGEPTQIIFNDGGTNQTADLDFKDGGVYNSTGRIITLNDYSATFKTDGMDEVWAYVWKGSEMALGEWPGTKLEPAGGVYTVDIKAEEAPEYIIFHNNAGEQTPDLKFEPGKAYEYMLSEYSATFTTDAEWTTVNVYAWSNVKEFAGDWPGTALEAAGGVYTWNFKAFNAPENVQFNDGTDKTPDMAFIDGKAYKWITATPFYALKEGDTFKAGTTVDLTDVTITFGVDGGADFGAAVQAANEDYAGFTSYTGGNGENGSADGGTVYTIKPVYDGTITVGVRLNGGKSFFVQEDGESMEGYNGITIKDAANTSYGFPVKAGSTYKIYCTGSKLGFFGFDYKYEKPSTVEDYTNYIVNADLTGTDGFDTTGTKGLDGSGIVKVGNAADFDFKQTIKNLPAGQYKLTAQAAYRFGGDEQAEADAIDAGTNTKLVQLYATAASKTVNQPVMNRYDGASDTDYANGSGSVVINGKYVPNSSNAVKAWFDAGQYVNELVFNLEADGDVTIGINRISTPAQDYTVIGPWTLTRLGDAQVEPEPETPEPGTDMTEFIVNNSFETGDLTGWNVGSSSDTGVKPNSDGTYATEGCDGDYLFNTWWQGIPITQTIANLPNGTYELKALMTNDAITAGNQPCLYLLANGQHSEPFASERANLFTEGSMQFYVTNGTATIGAIGGNADGSFNENGYYWYKVDNFRLTFVNVLPDVADIELPEGKMSNAAAESMAAAKEAGDIAALLEAVQKAKESIAAYANAKAALDAMLNVMNSTNVYTADAYDTYYNLYTDKLAAYEEGTMTDEEAKALENPELRTNWQHEASVVVDDLLLSAWSIGEAKAVNYDTALYINTWSSEGEGDGTNFLVPFYEYWTGDDNSLGETTISAEVSGVEPGAYKVNAWVRVRGKNFFELPAQGITLQANDGTPVSVVGDRLSEESNFYLANVQAYGIVGDDGVLNIKFNVAGDNNISWLSFKNVTFEPYEVSSYTVAGAFNTTEGGIDDVIFGTTWTPELEDNDMVKGDNGIYTLKKLSVELEPGTILYKVVANHTWDALSWGFNGNNADYVVNEAGTYDITFYFNPDALLDNGFNVHCVVAKPVYGDVNGDGQVGIGDIVAITNVMAGIEQDPVIVKRAHVNDDEEVGIGDIVAITNIMAGITTETTEPTE